MICYNYISEYIRGIQKNIAFSKNNGELMRDIEDYAEKHHVPIIVPEVAKFISVLGNILKPQKILEIGTAIGYSSIVMADFLRSGGKIDTIEKCESSIEVAKANINKAGLEDTINILTGDALEILAILNGEYDMIFMDAAKAQYINFLPHCLRLLKNGGLLVSDNVLFKGMVANDELVVPRKKTIVDRLRIYLDAICNHPDLKTSVVPIGDGVALSYKQNS